MMLISQKTKTWKFCETFKFHHTYLTYTESTNCIEQSPSLETNYPSGSREIPRSLCNPKDYYRICKCPPPVPFLSQINPIHPPSHFLKIHLNIILPSTPGSSKFSFFPQVSPPNSIQTSPLPHTSYIPRLSHSSLVYHPNNIC